MRGSHGPPEVQGGSKAVRRQQNGRHGMNILSQSEDFQLAFPAGSLPQVGHHLATRGDKKHSAQHQTLWQPKKGFR